MSLPSAALCAFNPSKLARLLAISAQVQVMLYPLAVNGQLLLAS